MATAGNDNADEKANVSSITRSCLKLSHSKF